MRLNVSAASLLAVLLAAMPAAIGAPPPLGKPRPLRLPPVAQKTLPNGLRIVVLEDHAQPALWMRLAVPAGSIRDPADRMGLAQMTAGLLDKGTTTRTETQIADQVEGLGASLGAAAEEDYLIVSASGLSTHADTLLDLLADVTLRPTFPPEEIDRLRTRTLNAITAELAEPGALAAAAVNRLVYGAHPYGNYATGTPATLAAITPEDLRRFHDAHFAPDAATLFLAGDITAEAAAAKVEKAFGAWARRAVPDSPAAPPALSRETRPRITLIDRPGAAQTEIRIGVRTTGYRDPRRLVGSTTAAVLGLGEQGRLYREIRVKRGLTYSVYSYFSRNAQAGEFQIATFTKNPSTAEVIRLALGEVQKLAQQPPPAAEMAERKNFLIGTFALSVATPDGILRRLIPATLYGDGPNDLSLYIPRVEAVTPGQVQEMVRDLGVEGAHVVLVGDAKAIEDQVRPLGEVTKIAMEAVDLRSPTLK